MGGSLISLVNTHTPIPGGEGNFVGFSYLVSLDGPRVAFASGGINSPSGIYVANLPPSVSAQANALVGPPVPAVRKIVASNDELDGKIVRYPFFGPGALLDDKVAFWVVFVGDSEGVFVVGETRQGDADNDNDRDLRDVAGFMNCFNGTEMPSPPFECLQAYDVDGDGNVGGFDFQLGFHTFPNLLTGPQ